MREVLLNPELRLNLLFMHTYWQLPKEIPNLSATDAKVVQLITTMNHALEVLEEITAQPHLSLTLAQWAKIDATRHEIEVCLRGIRNEYRHLPWLQHPS